jgi:hypothetical protein
MTYGEIILPLAYRVENVVFISVTEESPLSKGKNVVHGILDLLIMRILVLDPIHGWAISERLKRARYCRSATARCIPLFTSAGRKAGSRPNGRQAKRIARELSRRRK